VFRYAVFRTSTALPGDLRILLPSLEFLARRRSWVFLTLRRFAPADGWRGISARPGPHVALRAARPPRLIFVGVIDRLHLVFNEKGNRPWTLSWRGVRLLGFDSHLRSASSSSRAGGPILPWALPLAGFAGANLRTRIGLDPDSHHRPPESACSGFIAKLAHPNPLMGLRERTHDAHATGPFSVFMGPMPGWPEQLRGPFRANSLSEVLHRP
jgi:hypothetical protein